MIRPPLVSLHVGGLYLVIPVFGAWLEKASRKDILLFLKVWGISLFLPYLKMLAPALGYIGNWGNMDILGGCDWNAFGTFYYVSDSSVIWCWPII